MDYEKKIKEIQEMSQRMRNDMDRLSSYLDTLLGKKYKFCIEESTQRALDIDQAMTDLSAIIAFLNVIQLELYSGAYTKELFELTSISKSEFSMQVANLSSYCKSLAFLLSERSRTARIVLDACIRDSEKSVTL